MFQQDPRLLRTILDVLKLCWSCPGCRHSPLGLGGRMRLQMQNLGHDIVDLARFWVSCGHVR